MAHVFISYSSEDKTRADAVCAALESDGIRCWIAPRDILPGVTYSKAIVRAINESQILVLVFTSASNSSHQVMREIERAASKNRIIILLRLEDVRPSEDIELFISNSHWLDALTPPVEAHLERLAETVSLLLTPDAPLRLAVHFAQFKGPGTFCCFINATNLTKDVDIYITHVWVESEPKTHVLNADRPLPKRLMPQESWETWIPLSRIPPDYLGDRLFRLVRAQLSTGEVIHSVENKSVPDEGYVPGDPVADEYLVTETYPVTET